MVLHNHTLQILLSAYGLWQGIRVLRRPREPSLLYPKKTKNPNPSPIGNRFGFFLFGGRGWIRTTEAESSRFTVCPHWPLGNTPIFDCFVCPLPDDLFILAWKWGFVNCFLQFLQRLADENQKENALVDAAQEKEKTLHDGPQCAEKQKSPRSPRKAHRQKSYRSFLRVS